jgi:hypothetical protein
MTGSGAAASKAVDLSTVALRRAPAPSITWGEQGDLGETLGGRWRMIDVAVDGNAGADPFRDHRVHVHDALALRQPSLDPVAAANRTGRFG